MRTIELIEQAAAMAGVARRGEISNDAFTTWLAELNQVYREIYTLYPWDHVKIFDFEVTTTTGTIVLPETVDALRAVRIDNNPLFPVSTVRLANLAPSEIDNVGTPSNYIYLAPSPVLVQPAAATTITIVSTSATDTSALGNVRIEGLVGGVRDFEELALNGITPVPGAKSFTEVIQITKPKTTGRITFDDNAANELASIAPFDQHGQYKRIGLIPPVDTSTTVNIEVTRAFEDLVSDDDSVLIPEIEGVVLSRLTAQLLRSAGEFAAAQSHEQLAGEKLQVALNHQLELNARTHQSTPGLGLFGHLGTPALTHHVSDTSVTGIGGPI